MRKIFKIIVAVFVAIFIVIAAFGALIFLDLAAYTATGAKKLTPTGHSEGAALVAYDPGLSGDTKAIADKVAVDLQRKGYEVTLAGIKSSVVTHTADFKIIVLGGPIYAGALTSSVKEALRSISVTEDIRIGVFGSGQGSTTPADLDQIKQSMPTRNDNALANAVIAKIGNTEDISARAQELVNQLTQ